LGSSVPAAIARASLPVSTVSTDAPAPTLDLGEDSASPRRFVEIFA
jgi:hypothetical protein